MTMLSDDTDLVIGVDTHRDTLTASVVHAGTGGHIASHTSPTTRAGLAELVASVDTHPAPPVWAAEGTGSYGAGLTRIIACRGEPVP